MTFKFIFIYTVIFAISHIQSLPLINDNDMVINTQKIIQRVNYSPISTWVAGVNPGFENLTFKEARLYTGVIPENISLSLPPLQEADDNLWEVKGEPTDFDARSTWSGCIGSIRNQGQCGSCWAFGASSALADRLCIYTKTATDIILSPQQMVSCDQKNYGCEGGYMSVAWKYMRDTGVVSEDCYSYTSGSSGSTGSCKLSDDYCPSSNYIVPKKYSNIYGAYSIMSVYKIMKDLYTRGPVETALYVYEDFYNYQYGVYQYNNGGLIGMHAIKMIGWGVTSNSIPYWLCANSWGTSWGMLGGYFKIIRGVNECDIEAYCVAG